MDMVLRPTNASIARELTWKEVTAIATIQTHTQLKSAHTVATKNPASSSIMSQPTKKEQRKKITSLANKGDVWVA
jgi:hypothetical protein